MSNDLVSKAATVAQLGQELTEVRNKLTEYNQAHDNLKEALEQLNKEEARLITELHKLLGIERKKTEEHGDVGYSRFSFPLTVQKAILEILSKHPDGVHYREIARIFNSEEYRGKVKPGARLLSTLSLMTTQGRILRTSPNVYAPLKEAPQGGNQVRVILSEVKKTMPPGFSLFQVKNNPLSEIFKKD